MYFFFREGGKYNKYKYLFLYIVKNKFLWGKQQQRDPILSGDERSTKFIHLKHYNK